MTPARALTTVISDFGGVLTTPLSQAFAAYQEHSGVSMVELGRAMAAIVERSDGQHPLFELERGRISEEEFLGSLERELGGGATLQEFRAKYFEHLHPNRPMIDYMRELRGRGLRMAILTNNIREWEPHWRAKLPELDEIFELVVDSAFVGMRKPEPEIYELTLEQLGGVPGQECLFVDDVEPNVAAARELGMTAVLYTGAEQAIAEIEAALSTSRAP